MAAMQNILIVDDNLNNLVGLENVLTALPVMVVKATSGKEALSLTLNHDFSLAILDVHMPFMDGYALAKTIREDQRTKNIPIIFLSAIYSEPQQQLDGYRLGAVDFMTTPFDPEILLSKVRVVLGIRQRAQDAIENSVLLGSMLRAQESSNKELILEVARRKEAEKLLKESEFRYRRIIETATEGIFIANEEYIITYVNLRLATMLGYEQGEMIGRNLADFITAEQLLDHEQRVFKRKLGHEQVYERSFCKKDGGELWTIISPRIVVDEQGQFAGAFAMLTDITERKEMEAHLEHSHILISNILDSLPTAVIGIDDKGRITHFNRKAEELYDKQSKDVSGVNILDALPSLPVSQEELDDIRAGHKPIHLNKTVLHSMLGVRLADVRLYPLEVSGLDHLVVIIEDVTERVRLEGMMVQTEKMLSLGGLAAGMAHEINNPLGGIMQSVQVMERRLHSDTPVNRKAATQAGFELPALWTYLETRQVFTLLEGVQDSAKRAAVTVSSMLEFSRKSEGAVAPVAVDALLDKAAALCLSDYDMKKKYDFRRISIERDYDASLPSVPCVANQIEQVLLNLLSNAAQAMYGRSDESEPPKIILRTRLDGNMVRIEVEDNGPGMDEATRKRIFEPFFTTKPLGIGTGLGLSVSYYIVTSTHEGSIEVESSQGKGTKFIIKLPLHQNPLGS